MKTIFCNTLEEVAQQTLARLRSVSEKRRDRIRCFFPTGKTPLPLYSVLAKDSLYWKERLTCLQIDEFISPKKIFQKELLKHLIDPVGLKNHFFSIDPLWSDLKFLEHVQKINETPIHLCVLGLGSNGHVGFHEPGIFSSTFLGGRVELSAESLSKQPPGAVKKAYTFGVGSFLRSEEILLMITGSQKLKILKKVLETPPTPQCPATFLKLHDSVTVITDVRI